MPIRSELEKYLKKDMAVDSKVSSATGTTRASGSDSGGNQKDLIIECRKKNSRGESVITHRFRKGKLLGKVRERALAQRRSRGEFFQEKPFGFCV